MTGDIRFSQDAWFWLLLALPLLAIVLKVFSRHAASPNLSDGIDGFEIKLRHPHDQLLKQLERHDKRSSLPKYFFYALAFVCLVTALAGPVKQGDKLPDPPRERDIVFIVDTSISMILKDYLLDGNRVDRMSVIRSMLADFIAGLQGDRVSLVVFADNAHVLVPLTNDQHLLHSMLQRLQTGIAGRSSAPGNAIALAVKQARKQPARHQVLVLLTDASLPIGDITAEQGALIAADAGLPLYTIAVGAKSYAAAEEKITGLIYHPADTALLEKLATIANGKHYRAGDSNSLQHAIADISMQHSNIQEQAPRYQQQTLFHWPLLTGLVIICLFQLRGLFVARRHTRA